MSIDSQRECQTCGAPLPRGCSERKTRCDVTCTLLGSVLLQIERLLCAIRHKVSPSKRHAIRAMLWRAACVLNAHEARSGRYRGVASERALQERARKPDA